MAPKWVLEVSNGLSWHRPRPVEDLRYLSEEELLNRVIRAKALLALCGNMTVMFRSTEGDFAITPELAKKLLGESKATKAGRSRWLPKW